MPDEVETIEKAEKLKKKENALRTLYLIALDIKAGRLPPSYSKKGAELASKYEGEQLEKYAYGGF